MKDFKIVICGGGSTYTAGIVKDLLDQSHELKIRELWLYDIDEERQNKVAVVVQAVVAQFAPDLDVRVTTDPAEAFSGANFIMAQMRVGGLEMRVSDEVTCLKHGVVGQETCGAGGMAYGMRTIYPMCQLVDYCEEYAAPDYWIVNYSNPAAIVAKAMHKLRPNARILDICDMPVEIEARMAEILGCELDDIEVDYFGLNHFGWFTSVRCKGEDVTDKLKAHVRTYGYISEASLNDSLVKDPDWQHTFENSATISTLFQDYLPNTYYQYYLMPDSCVEYMDINNTRGMQVINGREKRMFAASEALQRGEDVDLTQFYVGVHGRFIVDVVKSLALDLRHRHLVIVPNNGIIENLSDDATVEVPAYITDRGPEPVRVGTIPRFYKGLIENQDACEGLIVEAVIEGSYQKALQAFTLNRTIPSATVAKALLDDLIEQNKGYWPELK
ncbi:6-phospho-alpha-glucosidase [Collinsella sp. AGMB00827]|uniref:6-phospho-alpha-glucosidase n=1 Tax=Collinsella ureilytica TaxID=2869515 RepID=A0ABS7MJ73_9ACTN|nr:6-phospho-alpha-glucosidase [Collinsella urealyticum]MBY4797078.1 6-phospho-alpha-glucosidase [Collinsella urealyticum]